MSLVNFILSSPFQENSVLCNLINVQLMRVYRKGWKIQAGLELINNSEIERLLTFLSFYHWRVFLILTEWKRIFHQTKWTKKEKERAKRNLNLNLDCVLWPEVVTTEFIIQLHRKPSANEIIISESYGFVMLTARSFEPPQLYCCSFHASELFQQPCFRNVISI